MNPRHPTRHAPSRRLPPPAAAQPPAPGATTSTTRAPARSAARFVDTARLGPKGFAETWPTVPHDLAPPRPAECCSEIGADDDDAAATRATEVRKVLLLLLLWACILITLATLGPAVLQFAAEWLVRR